MKRVLLMSALFVAGLAGCEEESCTTYVDYMCTCHADDEGFDCEALRSVYSNPNADLEEQCALDLSDQRAADNDAGLTCDL